MTLRVHIVSWSSVYLTLGMKPKLRTEVNFAQSSYSTQSHGAFAYFEMKSFKCAALFYVAKLQLILPYIFTNAVPTYGLVLHKLSMLTLKDINTSNQSLQEDKYQRKRICRLGLD